MVFCEWESTFSVGIREGPLYRLSVVTDDGVSGGVWTRGEVLWCQAIALTKVFMAPRVESGVCLSWVM